jgi:hypothetical protein
MPPDKNPTKWLRSYGNQTLYATQNTGVNCFLVDKLGNFLVDKLGNFLVTTINNTITQPTLTAWTPTEAS